MGRVGREVAKRKVLEVNNEGDEGGLEIANEGDEDTYWVCC